MKNEMESLYANMQALESRFEDSVAKGNQKADKVEKKVHASHTRTIRWGISVFFVSLLILVIVGGAVTVAYIWK